MASMDANHVDRSIGCLLGASWIPARWYDNIENGNRGRDEIVGLARALARLDIV